MTGIEQLTHIVVLMMENRSFDHMLGAMKKDDTRIDGLNGNETNPDMNGKPVQVQAKADFQGQLTHDPDHHFPGTDLQIFGGQQGNGRAANMQGFVKSYFTQTNDTKLAQEIMYYFTPDKLPVLATLAKEFALFNSWFSSIPGPTICNRAFSHYGTSFGQVGMNLFYIGQGIQSIFERLIGANRTAKIYYYDQQSSTMEIVNLLQHQPEDQGWAPFQLSIRCGGRSAFVVGGGGIDGFADLGDFGGGKAAEFGVTLDDGFVLGQIDAERFVVSDERFHPLDIGTELMENLVGFGRSLLQLLPVQSAYLGDLPFNHKALHCILL